MSARGPRVRVGEVEVLGAGGDRVLVSRVGTGATHVVSTADIALLRTCRAFATLDEHARAWARRPDVPPGSRKQARRRLKQLARLDLFQAVPLPPPAPRDDHPLEHLVVLCRGRPRLAARAVRSALETAPASGPAVRITVVDDTAAPAERQALCQQLAGLDRRIALAGPAERARFRDGLAGQGVDPEVATFAMLGAPDAPAGPGAGVNAALLAHAGETVLILDQAALCRFATAPGAEPDARGLAGGDPRAHWFHADRLAALSEAPVAPDHPVRVHARHLGQPAGAVLGDADPAAPWWDQVPRDLGRVVAGGDARVLVTCTGVVGTPAPEPAWRRLALEGDSRDRAFEHWRLARRAVHGVRVAPRIALSRAGVTFDGATALDATGPLPPCLPSGAQGAAVFGTLLARVRPAGLVAHLPQAVLRDPGDAPAPSDGASWASELRPTLDEVIGWAADRALHPTEEPWTRLEHLGSDLRGLADLAPASFDAWLRDAWRRRCSRLAERLQGRLEAVDRAPDRWRRDVLAALEALEGGLLEPTPPVPVGLPGAGEPARALQALLGRYGDLLASWQAVVGAARSLRERGIVLGQPVGG